MDNRENLIKAIDHALKTGDFSKQNICKKHKYVCAFGVGRFFEEAFLQWEFQKNFQVNLLCDNNPDTWGKEIQGIRCISPKELSELKNVICIPLIGQSLIVEKQLAEIKIPFINAADAIFELISEMPTKRSWFQNNKLLDAYDYLTDAESKKIFANIICNRIAPHLSHATYLQLYSPGEYFFHDLFTLSEDEIFIDCGSYNGDSVKDFINAVHNKFSAIHAFEINSNNYKQLKINIKKLPPEIRSKINCYKLGVWKNRCMLTCGKEEYGSNESFSILKKENLINIEVDTIDNIFKDENVTFIKMDIEGAEYNALLGAKEVITKNKPKLAVCIYHRLQDFWEIPVFVKQANPDYAISIRHHQKGTIGGTVLYAY